MEDDGMCQCYCNGCANTGNHCGNLACRGGG